MPMPFFVLMIVSGVLYLVFAFVEPPPVVANILRVPRILGFLSPRVSRIACGLLILGFMLVLARRTHSFGL
jgi:hypothetical protein